MKIKKRFIFTMLAMAIASAAPGSTNSVVAREELPIDALTSEALPAKPRLLSVLGVADWVVQHQVIAKVAF